MFACSMYQGNQDFLDNVRKEAVHQVRILLYFKPNNLTLMSCLKVRRLQSHPSIALWAGNNENEVALIGNWYSTDENFDIYRRDYLSLYVNVIMDVVKTEDPSRTYIVS